MSVNGSLCVRDRRSSKHHSVLQTCVCLHVDTFQHVFTDRSKHGRRVLVTIDFSMLSALWFVLIGVREQSTIVVIKATKRRVSPLPALYQSA